MSIEPSPYQGNRQKRKLKKVNSVGSIGGGSSSAAVKVHQSRESSPHNSLERLFTFDLSLLKVAKNQASGKLFDHKKSVATDNSGSLSSQKSFSVREDTSLKQSSLLDLSKILDEYKQLQSEPVTGKDITELLKQESKSFLISIRTPLGVSNRNSWVHQISLGNVMTLNPMTAEELSTTQGEDESAEFSTEVILENFILYIVSHFCVGTEMRFISMQTNQT